MHRSAIVLAGGRSSRMGQDKALLPLGGLTLLGAVVRELLAVDRVEDVVVVGSRVFDPEQALGSSLPLVEDGQMIHFVNDGWPGQGPLGGLISGLAFLSDWRSLESDPDTDGASTVALLSCDLPRLTGRSVQYLFERLEGPSSTLRSAAMERDVVTEPMTPGDPGVTVVDVVMSVRMGRVQPLHSVLRQCVYPSLLRGFLAGERRLVVALAELNAATLPDELGSSEDADTPEDWRRLTGLQEPGPGGERALGG